MSGRSSTQHRQLSFTWMQKRPAWFFAASVGLLILASSFSITLYETETQVDAVTGSIRQKTIYLGLFSKSSDVISPLEQWLRQSGEDWSPTWRFRSRFTRKPWSIARESGDQTPIEQLSSLQRQLVEDQNPEQIRDFIRRMHGTDEDQQDAVNDVSAILLERIKVVEQP